MRIKTLEILEEVAKGKLTPDVAKEQIFILFGVSNSGDIDVGSVLKRIKMPSGNGNQLNKYTIGNTYKIERIKEVYWGKVVGLRSDDGVLRWLSYDRVTKEHELVS